MAVVLAPKRCLTYLHIFRDFGQFVALESQKPSSDQTAEVEKENWSPVYKTNLNYIRKRGKNTITMEDLEHGKDLEEEEFKTNAKPSTSRAMTTRSCNNNVTYQCDESDKEEDSDDFDESTNNSENKFLFCRSTSVSFIQFHYYICIFSFNKCRSRTSMAFAIYIER